MSTVTEKVQIQLDNSDGTLPVDTTTVEISREVHYNGQVVYRINGRKVTRTYVIQILFMFAKRVHSK